MTITAITITPEGKISAITRPIDLRLLQEAVNGPVDLVALAGAPYPLDMWINDEGMLTEHVNPIATEIAESIHGGPQQNYYGTVIFTGGPTDEDDTRPLSPNRASEVLALGKTMQQLLI